ncbi:MAG: hypothetical protein ACMG6S_03410 [Byssovorax sp.]
MMNVLRMHARKIAAGLLCLGALGAAGGVAYARSSGSCCKIGASCCYPGSPCCAHGAVAQQ